MQRNLPALLCILFVAMFANSTAIASCPTCVTGLEAPRFISGGIGEGELAALRDREKDYNTKIIFADTEGAYLANIEVVVRDAKGSVQFAQKNLGPILLIQLPNGGYDVSAIGPDGKSTVRALKVDGIPPRDAPVFVLK